ncbi:MAG: hypothetical protein GF313_12945 [Caldithrix sp.]|nr:hypothetical protein [Caldithrix sp.]
MPKYIPCILCWMLMFNMHILAQESIKVNNKIPILFLPQGDVIRSMNGAGFNNSLYNHITNISSSNPASLNDFNKMSAGLSFHFETSLKPAWLGLGNHERDQKYVPQSFGFVLPFKRWAVGFGFSQRYNSILDFGKVAITTFNNPDSTEEYFTASKSNIVHSYSGLLSYAIHNVITKDDKISAGLQYTYNSLRVEEQNYHTSLQATTNAMSWTAGLRYDLSNTVKLGLFYQSGPSFKDKVTYKGDDSIFAVDSSNTPNNAYIIGPFTDFTYALDDKMADKWHLGLVYQFNASTKITLEITQVYRNQLARNAKNHIDISGGLIKHITDQLSYSISFLSTRPQYNKETDRYFNTSENLYSFFLAGGLNIRLTFGDIDLAYATNTFSAGDWRKQHLGKVAFGVYL